MAITEKKINQRVVTASFSYDSLRKIIAEFVAKEAGIDLYENGITIKKVDISTPVLSQGTNFSAECIIVHDLDALPRCSPTNDAGK